MIGECNEHGYYRNDDRRKVCPVCGVEGKFIMNDFEIEKAGRVMAASLRHGKNGVILDKNGYAAIGDILDAVKNRNPRMSWMRPRHIEAIVLTDPKDRYEMSGNKIRATYGHTIDLDVPLDYDDVPEELFYPTSDDEVDDLLDNGIDPAGRAMVHLSRTYMDAKCAGLVHYENPIILLIDVDQARDAGCRIGRASKTVYLCGHVPAESLYVAEPEDYDVADETTDGDE